MATIACSACAAEKKTAETKAGRQRLPRGWHRDTDNQAVCGDCWKRRYVLRAVTLPVARPADVGWPELRDRLKVAWSESTALANWAATELVKADVARTSAMAKLPVQPPTYLYGLFRDYSARQAWVGATQGAIAVLNAVERKYKAKRFETIWLRSASLMSFRYPHPYPVDADGWSATWSEDGRKVPLVSMCLPGGRVTIQLRREASLGRQLAMFGQIASGAALPCEAAIYGQPKGGSRRNGVTDREACGGRRQSSDIMLKLVAWFPRKAAGERSGAMLLRTDPAALWVAEIEGHSSWILNADHARRKSAEHRVKLQRTGEDTKAEKRVPAALRRRISELRQVWARKYDDFMDTFTHTTSKQLAEYAARQGVAEVVYDDQDKSYLPGMPWRMLRDRLQTKLDERGIVLTVAPNREEADDDPESSAA